MKHIVGTANRRISNKKFRMMKCGIAALSLFTKIIMVEYLTSIFVNPCSIFVIRFFRVYSDLTGIFWPAAVLNTETTICPDTSYETTHSWNSEPQNIEQKISNDEVWNRCAQSFFKNNNDRIPYFDIRYSLFDIRYSLFQSFFFD